MKKRLSALALALLLAFALLPQSSAVADSVYFTAINDRLLDLNDDTMPFWSGGVLYVSSVVFSEPELGINYARSRDKTTISLFKNRKVLIFDLAEPGCYDSVGNVYDASVIVRGEAVFLPMALLAKVFDLTYSVNRVDLGYLVRVCDENAVLSDVGFLDAAVSPMAQRYAKYERAHTPAEPEPEPNTPQPADPEPTERKTYTLYFAVEVTDAQAVDTLLALVGEDVGLTFLFTPEQAAQNGALLRRLPTEGHSIALLVDGSQGGEEALAQLAEGNAAMWRTANRMTRLVYVRGAAKALSAVEEAGYCSLRFQTDFSGARAPGGTKTMKSVLRTAEQNGNSCRALLGTDASLLHAVADGLEQLRAEDCTLLRMTELTAR